jgi:hypothetical protein
MPDPVSWKVVEPGWSVFDRDGGEVGKVDQVVGDPNADIFTGLSVGRGAIVLDRPRFVPSEQVGEIEEGRIRLTIDADAFDRLEPYEEPPPGQRFLAP